ncbi:MAG: hypothetical protein KF689_00180 [Gemmatimonadaceae bacterium]|nr:hypothetical protein [Gemmatimonadaceae bacterium]MCW5827625.1 hypothetical protein [Gemmatimonadaceae bacterium]
MHTLAGVLAGAAFCAASLLSSLHAQSQPESPVAAGATVRVTAPVHFPSRALGAYAGVRNDSLFVRESRETVAIPRDFITRIELQTRSARAGAIGGAWRGALIAGGIGLAYASDGPQSALALLPVGALVGAGVGAVRKGKTWTPVEPDAVFGARVVAAAPVPAPIVAPTIEAPLPDMSRPAGAPPPLPPGFVGEQIVAGARAGAVGAGIGLLGGAALYAAAYQRPADGLGALGIPVVGALLGYVVAAPLGVAKYSRSHGIDGSLGGSYGGAMLGIVGLAGGGVGFFITVPWGAALGYNSGRR